MPDRANGERRNGKASKDGGGAKRSVSWASLQDWRERAKLSLQPGEALDVDDDVDALESFEFQQSFGRNMSLPLFEAEMPAAGSHAHELQPNPMGSLSVVASTVRAHLANPPEVEVTRIVSDGFLSTLGEESDASSGFSDADEAHLKSQEDILPFSASLSSLSNLASHTPHNATTKPPTPAPSVAGSVASSNGGAQNAPKPIPSPADGEHYFPEIGGEFSLTQEFSEHSSVWGENISIRWPVLISKLVQCTLAPFLLCFPLFSILMHTWKNKLEPWTTPYGTVLRSAKREGGMAEYLLRGAEAVMSAFLLCTLWSAHQSGDKLTKTELILFLGLYFAACIIYAVLHSMKRVRADSEWHWRHINEQWNFMEKTQVMIWCQDTKSVVPMSVWNICQSVLRHSGSEVPYGKGKKPTAGSTTASKQANGGKPSANGHAGPEKKAESKEKEAAVNIVKNTTTIIESRKALISRSESLNTVLPTKKEESTEEKKEKEKEAPSSPSVHKKEPTERAALGHEGWFNGSDREEKTSQARRNDQNFHDAAWWGAFCVAFTPLFSRFFVNFTAKITWQSIANLSAGRPSAKNTRFMMLQEKVMNLVMGSFWAGVAALKKLTYQEVLCRTGLAIFNFIAVLGMLYCASLAHAAYSRRLRRAGALSALLSYYEARRFGLPHFSLTSVTNIKCWLLARSWLIRQGPQYSIDAIVSVLFLITCCTWSWVCYNVIQSDSKLAVETVMVLEFGVLIGFFLMNIIRLGSEINHQFHDVCLFWNEQIKCSTLAVQRPGSIQAMVRCHTILDTIVKATNQAKNPINVLGLPFSTGMSRFLLTVMLSALGTVISRMLGFNIALNFGMVGL